jgi:hypothetical protein
MDATGEVISANYYSDHAEEKVFAVSLWCGRKVHQGRLS